jgi:cobalt/nickel transport system ATP-binding protein
MKLPIEEVIRRTKKALREVEMIGFEDISSHHLSFGEKKRISIATVFSMEPEVLVLDEPTSNLAPQIRRKLINLLKKIELTKIIASHDLEMVLEVCERVVLLNKGEVVKSGEVYEVMKDKKLMEENGLEVPLSICLL